MYGIIYVALNITNNKVYVGQTITSLIERKVTHCNKAKRNEYNYYFHNALRKYKDWEWNVLQFAYCKKQLDALEKYWIWVLNSMAPGGYNIKEGGSYGKHAEKSKRKMSEVTKGRKKSEEHCRALSKALIGYKHTKEARRNMSKAQKGVSGLAGKAIMCMETNEIYSTIAEASRKTGIHLSSISRVARGERKTAGRYHWKFIKSK